MNETGKLVHTALLAAGIETPMCENSLSAVDKLVVIQEAIRTIMRTIGLDLDDDSLEKTPQRVAKMYINEIFSGLDYSNFPDCSTFENKMQYDEMIIVPRINMQSVCEHHLVTIDGYVTVGYIPGTHVLGLSKINRIVQFFARRPQVQERLTAQIHLALATICKTDDVAVKIEATHFCVKQRGIKDQTSYTVTSKVSGAFRNNPSARTEFLDLGATCK